MVLSAPTILQSLVQIPCIPSMFFNLYYWNCNEKRTKINQKRPGLVHFLKKLRTTKTIKLKLKKNWFAVVLMYYSPAARATNCQLKRTDVGSNPVSSASEGHWTKRKKIEMWRKVTILCQICSAEKKLFYLFCENFILNGAHKNISLAACSGWLLKRPPPALSL